MVDLRTGRYGGRRYRLLISLRAFADEQLRMGSGYADAVRAHAHHYLDRLAGIPPWRNVARDLTVELEPDLDDLLIAIDRGASSDEPELRTAAARAMEPLAFLLTNLGLFDDARRRCDAALEDDLDDPQRGRLLVARAFLQASEDGISDYVRYASEAMQYLRLGDGVWTSALAMTTVAAQMFVPAQPAAEFEDALAQLDGDPSPGAEQDRADVAPLPRRHADEHAPVRRTRAIPSCAAPRSSPRWSRRASSGCGRPRPPR